MDKVTALLLSVQNALQGNPARFIGYGAAIVICGVVAVANQLGITRLGSSIDLPTALGLATAAITTLATIVETIRHYVTPVASLPAPAVPDTQTPVPTGSEPA